MTTPIERAVAELTRLDLCLPVRDRRPTARAVFESIDRDELADVIYPEIRLSPDHRPSEMVRALNTADAIIAHLTGDQS